MRDKLTVKMNERKKWVRDKREKILEGWEGENSNGCDEREIWEIE